jgi:hypothetical protein
MHLFESLVCVSASVEITMDRPGSGGKQCYGFRFAFESQFKAAAAWTQKPTSRCVFDDYTPSNFLGHRLFDHLIRVAVHTRCLISRESRSALHVFVACYSPFCLSDAFEDNRFAVVVTVRSLYGVLAR